MRSINFAEAINNQTWEMALPALQPGTKCSMLIRPKSESSNIKKIKFYYGDVWVCSGQSNMEFKMRQVMNASQV